MGSLRLLVIDDSPTIRKLVELSARATDYALDFAPTGREGAERAALAPPDVILLDYILPDMRGTDVCRILGEDARTAAIPVIVMSANGKDVRALFQGLDNVVDFLGKPFSATDVVARVGEAGKRRGPGATIPSGPPADAKAPPLLSFETMNEAAKVVYAHLRPALARIPAWMGELGGAAPAGFFARRLLTPEVIGDLLAGLLPIYRAALAPPAPTPMGGPAEAGKGPTLEGTMAGFSCFQLLRMLGPSHTGELTLEHDGSSTLVYVSAGEIVFVASDDPLQRLDDADLGAEDEAHARGKRLLLEAIEAPALRFTWRERAALPASALARRRRIPREQLALERARASTAVDSTSPVVSGETVFARTELFSQKVRDLDLDGSERRVLSIVDGRRATSELVRRSNLPASEVMRVLQRLVEIDLLARPPARGGAAAGKVGQRRVLILEPDVAEFQQPLGALMKRRREPLLLVDLAEEADYPAAVLREEPRMVLLNADAAGAQAESTARAVRARPQLTDVLLVAILEAAAPTRTDQLLGAGFDAVFVKPVSYLDLERLLAD